MCALAPQTLKTDVLVIGGGAAGIRAALSAAENEASVLLVSSVPPARGGSSFRNLSRGWGIQALFGEERTDEALEAFIQEILTVGLGCADPHLAQILAEESGPCLADLLDMGVRFKRQDDGRFVRARGCFSRVARAFLTERMENVRSAFGSGLLGSPVKIISGEAVRLLIADGQCWGAWVLPETGEDLRVVSAATILATGGGAGIFRHHMVRPDQVGTGYALALEAGATLENMAFIQFMLVMHRRGETRFLPLPELARGGALKAEKGGNLLEAYVPDASVRASAVSDRQLHYPLSTRDASVLVDLAVARENTRGPVEWVDSRDKDGAWVVRHAAHAFNGGIRIDARAESTVPGLFAAGETASGPHGADRMGGCMMTATQVFGNRAGRFAAQRAQTVGTPPERLPEAPLPPLRGAVRSPVEDIREQRFVAASCLQSSIGVMRSAEALVAGLERLGALRKDAGSLRGDTPGERLLLHRLRCHITVGEAVARAALARETSLGGHLRMDSPAAEAE